MKTTTNTRVAKTAQGSTDQSPRQPPARWPRLLDDRGAAEYLGVSRWSIRDYVASGKLPSVALPATTPKEGERDRETLRRLLINITDLNAFVEANKQRRG